MAPKHDIKISVAMATYNGAGFVADTLKSILAQSFAATEIIVVNDGSTDSTAEILAEFGDALSIRTIENSGPETAKKIAVEATAGDWVAICDHDDLWDEDHLQRLVALVEAYPEVGAAYSNFAEFDDAARYENKFFSLGENYWKNCPEDKNGFRIFGPSPFAMLLRANPFFPSAGMFRRALYDSIGGIRPGLSRNPAADGDMTSRMVISAPVGCDSKITVHIRKYGGNFSGEGFRTSMGGIELLERQLAEGGVFEAYEAEIHACIRWQATNMLQAAFSYRNRQAYDFATKRLVFAQLPLGLKFRYLVFKLPDFCLTPIFWIVRKFSRKNGAIGA